LKNRHKLAVSALSVGAAELDEILGANCFCGSRCWQIVFVAVQVVVIARKKYTIIMAAIRVRPMAEFYPFLRIKN